MALKGCITKAGKALDADDREYMTDLMKKGRPDDEVLNRLEQRIVRERDELIETLEDQGIPVAKAATASEEIRSSEARAGQRPAQGGEVVISEDAQVAAVSAVDREGQNGPSGRSQGGAPPTPDDASRSSEPELLPGFDELIKKADAEREQLLDAFRKKLSEQSDLLKHFLKSNKLGADLMEAMNGEFGMVVDPTMSALAGGDMYNTELDTIIVSNQDFSQNMRDLDLTNDEDVNRQVEILEHELLHAYTVPYIVKTMEKQQGSKKDRDNIEFLADAVVKLERLYRTDRLGELSEAAQSRVEYILAQPSITLALTEFVAVMGAEESVSPEIYRALTGSIPQKTLRARISAFLESMRAAFLALTPAQMAADMDAEALQTAIMNTFIAGKEMREQRADEWATYRNLSSEHIKAQMTRGDPAVGINLKPGLEPPRSGIQYERKASFDYLNYAVATMLNSRIEREGKRVLGNLHDMMYAKFPIYQDVADKMAGIYDGSPALQQFVATVTGEGVNKVKKADVLAKYAAVNAQRTEIINDQVARINMLSKDLSDKEKADLDVFISQLPLHDYFVMAPDMKTAEDIEAGAELLRKELWKINARAVRDVEQLIDWNIDGNLTGNIYNLETKYPMSGEFGMKLRKYMALESIKRVGADKFEKLLRYEDLMDVIKDNSVANVLSTLENEGTANVRDSLIMDYYKEPFQIKAVTQADFRMYEYGEETGWKILQNPTRTQLGIVYKPTIDSTEIAGAYTDTKLSSTDIDVAESMRKMQNVVETRNGYKLLLTKEQKQELGLIEDFAQGLVRTAAHSIAIQESQIIRDELLKEDTYLVIGKGKSINKLQGIIESENIDNPWFLGLEEGTEYSKLPADIRARYMPVGKRASNVKNFNDNVQLVRKDISHWLLGGSAKSLFENPQLKWAMRILKNLVSGAKIGMIVLNPIKIANDNLSNLTYLGVLGVDPVFITRNYKEISTDFAEYSDLQRQIFQAKLQLVARPESTKIKKQIKALQKRLMANPLGDIADKGFVNSLGSDLVSRSADTLSGFQADMHTALEYLLTDSRGSKNYLAHFIMEMQKIGYQAEDFFNYLGDLAGKAKSTQLLQQELDQVAARLREIKSEEDIVNYVAQFTTSPSSEAVRFGSAMTDLTDVLAKETLYRHLVENKNMKPEDARIQVLDSFPDYKENMPLSIQQLSDVGILMFPSFWLRIQKIIYRMVRDKPVNLATELMIQEMLGTDINTIFEANVINKANTFGGLIHMPFEPVGVGSVVPTHTF